jgi:hypothetical protein
MDWIDSFGFSLSLPPILLMLGVFEVEGWVESVSPTAIVAFSFVTAIISKEGDENGEA